jgi:hypothetical protein
MAQYLVAIHLPDDFDPSVQDKVMECDIDGPYLETKEHPGGLSIGQAADMGEALTWTRRGAVVCWASGEVRPFFRSNTPSE